MAARLFLPEDELTCPVCCDIFKDPVLLQCCHSFCKACQEEWWRQTGARSCPVCKKESATATPPVNLALKNLSEAYLQEQIRLAKEGDVLCSLHGEAIRLFCLEDLQPICVVCRHSKHHKNHDCIPINEAVEDHMVELQTVLDNLQCKLKLFHESKSNYNKIANHIPIQAQEAEKKIKDDFKKMYQFLRHEEATRIDLLRKEEMQKSERMKNEIAKVDREIASLSGTITCVSNELKATHIALLKNFKATMDRSSAKTTLPDPPESSEMLINIGQHVGNLTFRVWEKMHSIVTYSPVILDPNTTKQRISEDLTSENHNQGYSVSPLRHSAGQSDRFDDSHILGCEGFSSGTHSWEVEVGDSAYWKLGVANDNHSWIMIYTCGVYVEHSDGYVNIVIERGMEPHTVRVVLNRDKGKLSFFDSDRNRHLHTILTPFTGKVFPMFYNYRLVKILPTKICIKVSD